MFLAGGELFHRPGPQALTVDAFAGPFERLLRDGVVDGSLREVDPAVAATVLFNSAGWGYIHLRASHHWPPEQARAAVTDLVLGACFPAEPCPTATTAGPPWRTNTPHGTPTACAV
jgi:hypothetical protein